MVSPHVSSVARARELAGLARRGALRARHEWDFARHAPRRHVFVVSGGRSGSTLVQGILNTLPRTLVRGENGMMILPLFRAEHRLRDLQRQFGRYSTPVTSAFYGLARMDADAMSRTTRRLMLEQLLGGEDPRTVDVLGFKEVRWEEIAPDETRAFFDYMDRVFPGAQYVLNTRQPEVVIHSGHWQEVDNRTALQMLARVGEIQDWLRKHRPRRSIDTTFEVITGPDAEARDAQLRALAQFVLGRPCDPETLDEMRAVLKVGHGPYPFGKARRDGAGARRPGEGDGPVGSSSSASSSDPAGADTAADTGSLPGGSAAG